jgi:hypothetical protein
MADAKSSTEKPHPDPSHASASSTHQDAAKRPVQNDANTRHDDTPSAYGQALPHSCCDCGTCCADSRDYACADNSHCTGSCSQPCATKASPDGAEEQSYRQHGGG